MKNKKVLYKIFKFEFLYLLIRGAIKEAKEFYLDQIQQFLKSEFSNREYIDKSARFEEMLRNEFMVPEEELQHEKKKFTDSIYKLVLRYIYHITTLSSDMLMEQPSNETEVVDQPNTTKIQTNSNESTRVEDISDLEDECCADTFTNESKYFR